MRTKFKLQPWTQLLLASATVFAFGLGGCDSGDGDDSGDTTSNTSDNTDNTDGTDNTNNTSGTDTSNTDNTDTTDNTSGTDNTDSTTTDALKELGEQCAANEECAGNKCNLATLPDGSMGGVCSECLSDKECADAGTGVSCGLDLMAGYFTCQTGELGDSCETDENCKDELVCAELIVGQMACSSCKVDADCADKQVCASTMLDPTNPSGIWRECRDAKTLADGELCDIGESGENACVNHCSTASTPIGDIGVCGECRDEADCSEGETCTPASASLGGITPSACTAGDDTGTSSETTDTSSTETTSTAPLPLRNWMR